MEKEVDDLTKNLSRLRKIYARQKRRKLVKFEKMLFGEEFKKQRLTAANIPSQLDTIITTK